MTYFITFFVHANQFMATSFTKNVKENSPAMFFHTRRALKFLYNFILKYIELNSSALSRHQDHDTIPYGKE
jgi:hypothetical protein